MTLVFDFPLVSAYPTLGKEHPEDKHHISDLVEHKLPQTHSNGGISL
jgi:hypothetical protein